MTSMKQRIAAKRNIKIAREVWNRSHYSVEEGKIEPKLETAEGTFNFVSKHGKQAFAILRADSIRREGYKVHVKWLDVGGKRIYLVYKGPRREKTVHVPARKGVHKAYTKSGSMWSGYGHREKPGRGVGR